MNEPDWARPAARWIEEILATYGSAVDEGPPHAADGLETAPLMVAFTPRRGDHGFGRVPGSSGYKLATWESSGRDEREAGDGSSDA